MKFVRSHWFIILLVIVIILIFVTELALNTSKKKSLGKPVTNNAQSFIPDIKTLSNSEEDNLIRYGRELIMNTAKYFGPNGMISHAANGMNCQNCHMDAGIRMW